MKRPLKLRPPTMPNFVGYIVTVGKKQDGVNFENNKFPITEFSKEEAEEYGELMKQAFIEHWENKCKAI